MFELFCQLFAQAIFIFVRDEKWMLTLVNVVWLPVNWLVLQRRTRHGYLKEQSKAKPFVSGRGCKRWQFCGIYVSGLLKIIVLVISSVELLFPFTLHAFSLSFCTCLPQAKMEELQLFRGDTVLIKGKKRRDTVSKLYDTVYLETTTAVRWTLLYLRNIKREICSYFYSSPSIIFLTRYLYSLHI